MRLLEYSLRDDGKKIDRAQVRLPLNLSENVAAFRLYIQWYCPVISKLIENKPGHVLRVEDRYSRTKIGNQFGLPCAIESLSDKFVGGFNGYFFKKSSLLVPQLEDLSQN